MPKISYIRPALFKKLLIPFLIYIFGVVVLTWINYQRTKTILLSGVDKNLYLAAQTIRIALPGNLHDYATNKRAVSVSNDWRNIKKLTELALYLKIDFLYTIVIKDGKAYFTCCSTTAKEIEEHSEAHYWTEYPEASEELLNIRKTNKVIYETTVDRWGTFRSVLVPTYSPNGNLYVLGADYEISYITNILHKEVLISALIAFILSLLIIPFAIILIRIEKGYSSFLKEKIQERTKQLTQEIIERKRTEEQLNEALINSEELAEKAHDANKAKGEFLATMSHEIRTPLNVIVGMSSLLNQSGVSPEQSDYLKTINDSSDHLLNLIDNILDFSLIESRKVQIEHIQFDIHELINYSVSSFMSVAKHKNIILESDTDERIPKYLKGDPSYLRQVLFNLIGNAIKFTERGMITVKVSFVKILAESRQIELKFTVTDTGIGIPDQVKEDIFEKFRQSDSSTKRKYGGTGMGLAISKHIISLLNGSIWFESDEGKGSSFYFTLVFGLQDLEESKKANIESEGYIDEINLHSLHILLAEDNKLNVKVAKSFLEKLGHNVTVALNGLEAIQFMTERKFDLILMDIEMPEMDGIEAATKIREGYDGITDVDIPIIALTAHALTDIREQCNSAGMNYFITKPLDFKLLNGIIGKVLQEAGRI